MTIQDFVAKIKGNNEQSAALRKAKYTFLQRLSIKELSDIYNKYCYVSPQAQSGPSGAIDLLTTLTAKGGPNTRQTMITAIAQNMSWDSLKVWAKEHKIDTKDIGV